MATLIAVNPATGEAFAETPETPVSSVRPLLVTARAAQAGWAARPLRDRVGVVREFQRLLFLRRREMAELITRENGKPLAESLLVDIAVVLDFARYYANHAESLLRPRRIRLGNIAFLGKRGHLHWDPMGVVGIISPWNYPLLLPFGEMIPALLAGNAVAFKPSEFTTRTALLGVELLYEAGVPRALCPVLVGGGPVGAALIEAGPDKICFTGSARTGRRVAAAAAERLIPVNLELGGSDPCIVLADADLERAASGAIWARFTNGGQTCVAAKRIIVERPVHARFLEELVRRVATLRLGPGDRPDSDLGPVIRPIQIEQLERQLGEAVSRGARVLVGGKRRPDIGPTFFEPTVVTDVPPDSPLWREEVFGPIMPVMVAEDASHAVRLANDSDYGLAASIWTGDRARGVVLARQIQAGTVQVNDAASHVGAVEAPHGGEKDSGLGRSHGEWGMHGVCRPRLVTSDRFDWFRKPWWFGYAAESAGDRDAFLQFSYGPSAWSRLRAAPRALRLLFNRRAV